MIRQYQYALTDEPDKDGFQPFMSACLPSGDEGEALRPAIVICPSGGYECVCEYREGELHISPPGRARSSADHAADLTQPVDGPPGVSPAPDVGGLAGRNIRPVNDSKELYV